MNMDRWSTATHRLMLDAYRRGQINEWGNKKALIRLGLFCWLWHAGDTNLFLGKEIPTDLFFDCDKLLAQESDQASPIPTKGNLKSLTSPSGTKRPVATDFFTTEDSYPYMVQQVTHWMQ